MYWYASGLHFLFGPPIQYTRSFGSTSPFTLNSDTGESGRYFYTDLTDDDFNGDYSSWGYLFGANVGFGF